MSCFATLKNGNPCRNKAKINGKCRVHATKEEKANEDRSVGRVKKERVNAIIEDEENINHELSLLNQCQYVLVKGKRSGTNCGRKCVVGEITCKLHSKFKEKIEKKCKAVEVDINGNVTKCNVLVPNNNYCLEHAHAYRLEKPDTCSICMENIDDTNEQPLQCGHWHHRECLKQWRKDTCPVCRQKMTAREIGKYVSKSYEKTKEVIRSLLLAYNVIFSNIENSVDLLNYNQMSYFIRIFTSYNIRNYVLAGPSRELMYTIDNLMASTEYFRENADHDEY